jgi:phage terminase small subunit
MPCACPTAFWQRPPRWGTGSGTLTSIIHSCLAMLNQVLRNPRHERFAQELATGETADSAYVLAGYKENRSNAARLGAARDIQARVAEIQSVGAERAAITVVSLIAEAEKARSKAMSEKGGANAAVAAVVVKAKLAGLWLDKTAITDPSGEKPPRYIISDRPMTEEEWIRERCGE